MTNARLRLEQMKKFGSVEAEISVKRGLMLFCTFTETMGGRCLMKLFGSRQTTKWTRN